MDRNYALTTFASGRARADHAEWVADPARFVSERLGGDLAEFPTFADVVRCLAEWDSREGFTAEYLGSEWQSATDAMPTDDECGEMASAYFAEMVAHVG